MLRISLRFRKSGTKIANDDYTFVPTARWSGFSHGMPMKRDLLQPDLGSALSRLLGQLILSFAIGAAGVAGVAFLFPALASRHAWFLPLAWVGWGCLAGVGLCSFPALFQRFGQRQVPATLTPERYKGLEEFTRSLSLIVGPEELFSNQIGKLRALVEAERVAILVSNARGEPYTARTSRGYEEVEISGVAFPDHSRLVRWLYTNETYLIPSENPEVMTFLKPEERDCLETLRVNAVFPLMALNRLIGMVFVARGGGLSPDQIEAVSSFTPQVALAIENAILYEQQRVRMRRLYRADRLATVGQLAAGAAHEIRNPLTSIRSTIQYLRQNLKGDPKRSRMMGDMLGEADRINAIVEGLLTLARPAELKLEVVDLTDVVAQTVRLVEPTARKGHVEVETRFPREGARLQADPSQLKQVFLNVMMNALQAMPDGGRLSVCVSRFGRAWRKAGWKVEIADTGTGIPEGRREKIFDPFFTTKRDGTGLGLSICHSILQSHGGEIDVQSTTGKGTRVEIRL